MKRIYVAYFKVLSELKNENSNLKKKLFILEKDISVVKSKSKKLEEEILSEAPIEYVDVINNYDIAFPKVLAQNINRIKMDSMIYGVSKIGKEVLVMSHLSTLGSNLNISKR